MDLFSNWIGVVVIIKELLILKNKYTLVLNPLIDFFGGFASTVVPSWIARLKEYSEIGLFFSAIIPLKLYLFVVTGERVQLQTYERVSQLVCQFVELVIERIFWALLSIYHGLLRLEPWLLDVQQSDSPITFVFDKKVMYWVGWEGVGDLETIARRKSKVLVI